MRLLVPAALVLAGLLPQVAGAETTVIRRDAPDTIVVDRPAVERKTVETRETSDGCASKTVSKTNEFGDRKTVTKQSCD